jgi:hypothetical protein
MSGRRRDRNQSKAFNPRLIFSQIVALQCFHYLVLGFMFQVNHVLYGTSITKDRMFTDEYFKLWSWSSLPDNMAVILSSLVGYVKPVWMNCNSRLGCWLPRGLWLGESWPPFLHLSHFLFESFRSVLLAIIVEKSKKCLDFSLTLFLLHFFLCIMYGGLPRTWDWYIIHILGTITMILMGEHICAKREMDDIPMLVI